MTTPSNLVVAVDAMGGDFAPDVNIKGSLLALTREPSLTIALVGDKTVLTQKLRRRRYKGLLAKVATRLKVVQADEVITMDDPASVAVRKKTRSSIHVGLELLKNAEAQAFVSAGHSGAVMAASMVVLGRIAGVERPAIVVKLPTATGSVILLDAGANVDCKPSTLVQFAVMGQAYARVVEGIQEPRVGLLSNGSEASKGNETTRETHTLLSERGLPGYLGNIEGYDVFRGSADVVVCDGFVGNVILKSAEGLGEMVNKWFRRNIKTSVGGMVGVFFMLRLLSKFKQKFNYQEYGAAPLLGTNGLVMIAHGKSNETAIVSGILMACKAAHGGFIERISKALTQETKKEPTP